MFQCNLQRLLIASAFIEFPYGIIIGLVYLSLIIILSIGDMNYKNT